jgi:hypothetical protein
MWYFLILVAVFCLQEAVNLKKQKSCEFLSTTFFTNASKASIASSQNIVQLELLN